MSWKDADNNFLPLEHLRFLRDEYSDEIPTEIIHSTAKNNRFKVRKAWFAGLVGDLELVITDGLVTDRSIALMAEAFMEKYTGEGFQHQVRTTKEDIELANNLINLIIGV
jgi:hypothetical protein